MLATLGVATLTIRYRQQADARAPNLLVLANQAEEKQNWPLTITRLNRYLVLQGEDYPVLRRLADLYYEQAATYDEIRTGVELYTRCIKAASNDDGAVFDLKLRQMTMRSRIYPSSGLRDLNRILPSEKSELRKALKHEPRLVDALRLRTNIVAYQLSKQADRESTTTRAALINDYEVLASEEPDNAQAMQKLASLYRDQSDAMEISDPKYAAHLRRTADRTMDESVASNPSDVDLLLNRFQYRLRYSKSQHAYTSDFQRVLELDSSNPRVLRSLAAILATRQRSDGRSSRAALLAARDLLVKSMSGQSNEPDDAVLLANIHLQLQDAATAAQVLETAALDSPDDHLLLVAQAKLAIEQQRFDFASERISRIRMLAENTLSEWSPGSRSTSREKESASIRLFVARALEAELLLEAGALEADRQKAIALLRTIQLAQLEEHRRTDVLQDVGRLFARCQEWGKAIDAIQRSRTSGIVSPKSEFLLASCYERNLEFDKAIQVYREIASKQKSSPAATDAWYRLGMLVLRTQPGRSETEKLDQAQVALDNLSVHESDSEEAFLLSMYLQLAKGIEDPSKASKQLQAAESQFKDSLQYWILCTEVYRITGASALLNEAVDRLAEVAESFPESIASDASRVILTTPLTGDDLNHVKLISHQWGSMRIDERLDSIRRWREELPNSTSARIALVNMGVALNRPRLIDEAVESLKRIETGSDCLSRIATVSKHLVLFREGSQHDGREAKRKAEKLASEYPRHPLVARLAATCQETSGDAKAASEHYLRALKIGSTAWAVDGRLRTLVHARNWDEALVLVQQLPSEFLISQEGRLELIVHVLCEHHQFRPALQLVRQFSEKHQRSTAHTHYLLAVIRMREGGGEHIVEAHHNLQRAIEISPSNLNYWIALFHLEIGYRPELWTMDACRTANRIRWLLEAHSREFAPQWTSLILAQTLQVQGRLADADSFFRKTAAIEHETIALGWIPSPILSKAATATQASVTPEISLLAGRQSVRTLAAIQTIWHRKPQSGLEKPGEDPRLWSLIEAANGNESNAIKLLELIELQHRGIGDYLLLAELHQRGGDSKVAREYRIAAIRDPGTPPSFRQKILEDAMATDDFELALLSVNAFNEKIDTSRIRQLIAAQLELQTGEPPEDIQSWFRERQETLVDQQERALFARQMVDVLASHGHVKEAEHLLGNTLGDHPNRGRLMSVWVSSQPNLIDMAMPLLSKAQIEEPPTIVIQMLYQIASHLSEQSPHRGQLVDMATSLLNQLPDLSRASWITLGSVFERLRRPKLAVRAFEMSLPEDGSPSLDEHHLLWIKGGYLRDLPHSTEAIDRLTRRFGPREDLMDTQAIFLLIDGQTEAAKDITNKLALHDPTNTAYDIHDRLVAAYSLPKNLRRELYETIKQEQLQKASVLARDMWHSLLTE